MEDVAGVAPTVVMVVGVVLLLLPLLLAPAAAVSEGLGGKGGGWSLSEDGSLTSGEPLDVSPDVTSTPCSPIPTASPDTNTAGGGGGGAACPPPPPTSPLSWLGSAGR